METEAEVLSPNDRERRQDSRTVVALAERVAVVETKLDATNQGIAVIRNTQHDTNNRMTEFVAAERMCATNLATLIATQSTMQAEIRDMSVATNGELRGLAATVRELTLAKAQIEGGWKATLRIGAAIAAILTAVSIIGGGIAWVVIHTAVQIKP